MKNKALIIKAKYFLFVLLTIVFFTSCNKKIEAVKVTRNDLASKMEYAYFEGQKDALEGDVKIGKNQDSCWIWIKSPWDDGTQPIFDPSSDCSQTINEYETLQY